MSFRKSDFFAQFRAFYIKEFTRQEIIFNFVKSFDYGNRIYLYNPQD